MKKIFCIFLCALVLLCCAACGSEAEEEEIDYAQQAVDAIGQYLDGEIGYSEVISALDDLASDVRSAYEDEDASVSEEQELTDSAILVKIFSIEAQIAQYEEGAADVSYEDIADAQDALADLVLTDAG